MVSLACRYGNSTSSKLIFFKNQSDYTINFNGKISTFDYHSTTIFTFNYQVKINRWHRNLPRNHWASYWKPCIQKACGSSVPTSWWDGYWTRIKWRYQVNQTCNHVTYNFILTLYWLIPWINFCINTDLYNLYKSMFGETVSSVKLKQVHTFLLDVSHYLWPFNSSVFPKIRLQACEYCQLAECGDLPHRNHSWSELLHVWNMRKSWIHFIDEHKHIMKKTCKNVLLIFKHTNCC